MEARAVVGFVGCFAAFFAGWFAIRFALGALGGKRAAASLEGSDGRRRSGWLAWAFRNGFSPFAPAARFLLGNRRVDRFAEGAVCVLDDAGYGSSRESAVSLALLLLLAIGAVAGAVSASLAGGLAVASCALAVAAGCVGSRLDKRKEALRESVPDVLRSIGVCFRSGLSLLQTMRQVARETEGPMRAVFSRVAHRLETGSSAGEALSALRESAPVSELAFVAIALDVQHQAGGSMERVLDAARDTVQGELDLARSLRVQTAQAKLSARIVSVMPLVLVALFSLVSEGFLTPFFSSFAGMVLLAAAVLMQVAGILAVRGMLKVEVG